MKKLLVLTIAAFLTTGVVMAQDKPKTATAKCTKACCKSGNAKCDKDCKGSDAKCSKDMKKAPTPATKKA